MTDNPQQIDEVDETETRRRSDTHALFALLGIVLLVVVVGGLRGLTNSSERRLVPTPRSTPNPFVSFTTVRNTCGQCGTSSPVGGWETSDGRALILQDDGGFTVLFADGTSMAGSIGC